MTTPGNNFVRVLIQELLALGQPDDVRSYRAGEVVFSAGDPGDGFYIIDSGQVRISAVVGQDELRDLATISAGDFFGEMAVVDDAPRSATAIAEVDTKALFVRRETLLPLLDKRPQLAHELTREFSIRMRALNQKYLQAERLAMVGRFARTIVHDFKNPLAIIGLAAELACSEHTAPAMRQKAQHRISQQVDRMTNMLQELIEFTKPSGQRPNLRPVDFAGLMTPLLTELRHEVAERRVEVVLENDPPPVEVRLDAKRMARLFQNLFNNAVDEMTDGGKILLRFRSTASEVTVEIEDTGGGIAPEIAAALFTPFATFGKAQGTGLGLTICKRIVEDHGGRIWAAASEPGKGAVFCFTLPLLK